MKARSLVVAALAGLAMLAAPQAMAQEQPHADQPAATAAGQCYQNFTVNNKGAYVMWFQMQTKGGVETSWTGSFPVAQSRTIDMGRAEIAEGTQVRVHAKAAAGMDFYSGYVTFCKNGYTKTWDAYGTTFNAWLEDA
ncbi:hypothetical protein GCM10012275_26590 [Longimycelium tulufanense]|uniref:Uncharacterized protein n=1 Tax=Longimycelium tulufanense TaxID=907463 RepID=A0A8J3C866_9PSEU|nr:hypothetical protein [Longimycelium tulufanense]GGM54161.1 hypothetical protein GCM10012275_26590 [Longimycelium tulufanense]